MPSTTPPIQDLAAHTFGRHHFSPPPLPERLERGAAFAAQDIQVSFSPELDLDQRIRNVGEW